MHPDRKPSNIFICSDGAVKIMDLGIAHQNGRRSLTVAGKVMGTPAYLAPERRQDSKHVDARSDLFNVGLILYEMLTGHLIHASLS
ncbi:MAG: protein kinase domain-containing protein [Candidatus Xenobia bacterium]